MIPLRSLLEAHVVVGPPALIRYNDLRAVTVQGSPAPGVSSGQALKAMEDVAAHTLASGFVGEWTDTAFQEKRAEGKTTMILGFAVLFAYLFLVGLYESWTIPVPVLLSVSVGILGSFAAIVMGGLTLDLYGQIGMIVLIGLAAKTASSSSNLRRSRGRRACPFSRLQRRARACASTPVMMTSLAFILGLLPLVVAVGASQLARRNVGTPVFGGMILASVLGDFRHPAALCEFPGDTRKAETFRSPQTTSAGEWAKQWRHQAG